MSWLSSMSRLPEPGIDPGGVRSRSGQLIERARGSRYVRSVAMLVGGTAIGQAVVILASPVLTRLYTPADFGVLAIFTSVVTLFVVVGSLRFEVGIPLAPDSQRASDVLWLSILVVVALSLGVWLVTVVAGDTLAGWADIAEIRGYFWLVPVAVCGGSLYRVFSAWATRAEAFGPLARTKINQGVTLVAAQVGLGLLRNGPLGLLLGWTAGQTSGVGTLGVLTWRQNREALRRFSIGGIVAAARRYRQLALMLSASTVLNTTVAAVPAIFLATYYGLGVAGAYALGQRVVAAPMQLIAGSMSEVYLGEAYRLKRERPEGLYQLFVKTVGRLTLVGAAPLLLVALTSPWVFALVFGSDWREAGVYLQVLAPMLVIQFIYNGFAGTLDVLEGKVSIVVSSIARAGFLCAGMVVAHLMGASALGAVALIGVGSLLGYLTYGLICWRVLAKGREA